MQSAPAKHRGRELKRLLPRHQKILSMQLAGMKSTEIARMLGLTTESVRMVVNSPVYMSEISRRQSSISAREDSLLAGGVSRAREIIDENAAFAAETQVSLLSDKSSQVKRSAAKDILDRALGSTDGNAGSVVIEAETIQLLQVTMNEVKKDIVNGRGLEEAHRGT